VTGVQIGGVVDSDIDIQVVQVFAPSPVGRVPDEISQPYKNLRPYTDRDRAIFKGRNREIKNVIRWLGMQRPVVVYGEAGVGKTSLLEAGVIPQLRDDGKLVVKLQDYTQPLEKTIREALGASPDQISIHLPEGLELPDLVRTVCAETDGTLVLVLDEFESLFGANPGDKGRAAIIESLAGSLRAVESEYLRMVIVLRAEALNRLVEIQDQLSDSWNRPIAIDPLDPEQARAAIKEPLAALRHPGGVSYVPKLVSTVLVPALGELTPDDPDRITPAHLQIVCNWLYQSASTRESPLIDEDLYRELDGADGILATYVDTTLETQLSTESAAAKHLMESMAYPGRGPWVPPEQLPLNGYSLEQVRDVLDRLAGAALLMSRRANGTREYAFASPIVAQKVRDTAPPAVRRAYQAKGDLERVWSGWLAHESLASRVQLGHLERARDYLAAPGVKVLLLLRSAVARNTLDNPWPAQLRGADKGPDLIQQLEEPEAPDPARPSDPSTLDKARRLLGLADEDLPDLPGDNGGNFGPVAWSAASHPDPVTRQTATLAMTALEPYPRKALARLGFALEDSAKGWQHWLRQGELRGSLADADPDNERLSSNLSSIDRLGMWWWRARRRVIRDRHRIFWLMVGGGIGAGLALGLLRAVIGALAGQFQFVGIEFATSFWWAWILGAALSLGITLARPLLLNRSEKGEGTPPMWRAPLHPDRRPVVLAVCLGTIFFGLTNLVVAWFNGLSLSKAPLVAPLGFVAGLGLSLTLCDQPRAGWHLGILRWLRRLAVAALAFVLTQAIFIIIAGGQPAHTLPIVRSGSYYYAQFFEFVEMRWPWLVVQCCTGWPNYLALIDAALVGIVLTIGITAGLLLAEDWLKRWRDLINQSGD
jgi:hypothetical protein